MWSTSLQENDQVTFTIRRDGIEKTFTGKAVLPTEMVPGFEFTQRDKLTLKEAWLKRITYKKQYRYNPQ